MKIRTKLILMLAIPIAALAFIAFAGFRDASAEAEINEDAGEIADAIIGLENLAFRVADERLVVARQGIAESTGSGDSGQLAEEFDAAVEATDTQLASVEGLGDLFAGANVSGQIASARSGATTAANLDSYSEALGEIEAAVERQPLTGFGADAVLAVDGLRDARKVAGAQEAVWLEFFSLQSELAEAAGEAEETESTISAQATASIISGLDHVEFVTSNSARTVLSTGTALLGGPANSSAFGELSQLRALAEEDVYNATLNDISPEQLFPLLLENRAEWNNAGTDASNFIVQDISANNDLIDDQRSLFTLFAVLGSLLLFTLIFVIGRSILGPLGRLMDHADTTTRERLPFAVARLRTLGASDEVPSIRPIPRETNDEIGSLVDAFNEIQETAVNIASDQAKSRRNVAEMFVSLGRRNQQLNHRMINLISDLEQDEQDPETLAGLYQIDHLATRMRRNAESLLVLAGNRSPRQWSRPVAMEDVVRSSLSEVELFERVEIGDVPELAMQGNVVTDVTHLLAELLDNATQFSEPSTTVQISAQETLEGVEIEVFDSGFGIGEQDLIELNERITNPPALDEAPSRLLGLFVVGRLSKQHGIDVQLQSQPGVGTVATISIPSSLFAEIERAEIEPPSALSGAVEPSGDLQSLAGATLVPRNRTPEAAPESPAIEPVAVEPVAPAPLAVEPVAPAPAAAEPTLHDELIPGEAATALPEDLAAVETEPQPQPSVEAIPPWDPAAVHEEQLADAAMPTMEEVEAAMPTFPGVTIEEPEIAAGAAPSAPVVDEGSWPLTKLDAPQAPTADPSIATIDSLSAPSADPEPPAAMPAPIVEEQADAAPKVDEPPAPIEPASVVPTAVPDGLPVPEAAPAVEVAAPEALEAPKTPVVADVPAPPVIKPALPAPPVVSVAPDAPVMPQPEVAPVAPVRPVPPTLKSAADVPAPPTLPDPEVATPSAPEMPAPAVSTGGLPTRSPQATLASSSDQTTEVIPLAGVGEVEAAPSNPSAFAAFASGVNRGLDKVRDTPKPQFSNEGEDDE